MNIREVKQALPFLLKHNICPFFWGSQGVGKTSAVKQYCKDNDLDIRVLYTATQDVGDLVGLLVKDDNGGVYHAKPNWFPTEGKGIVFLDELNRAPADVLQSLFSFVQNGTIHTHTLPSGWHVVAAGNYQSDRFNTTDTSDAAWMSRFCHIDFTPTVEEWLIHAESKGMFELASFIREQPSMLELSEKQGGRLDTSFIVPDRRAFLDGVGRLENDPEVPEKLKYELYSGMVGTASAAAFMSYKVKAEKSLQIGHILKDYNKKARSKVLESTNSKENVRLDLLNQPIDELISKLEDNRLLLSADGFLDNLKQFLLDIPRELSMKAFMRFGTLGNFFGKNDLLNDPKYVKKFT